MTTAPLRAARPDGLVLAVGVGSPLVGDAADGGSLSALRDRARRFRAVVEEAGR
ncbi:hypothetical protein ACFYZU_08880 [Streptomyces sp. NPDC001651]|uniref:hypothetical protein n=1 Tax=Streptomyces sp. NPDC001651 TaxID=3364596 RepID=UPI0036B105E5